MSVVDDLRSGLRSLRRSPAYAAFVALILALGIGATSAIVSVMSAVLLHGLPYQDPERLVLLSGTRARGGAVDTVPISWVDFEDWRRAPGPFSGLAAWGDPQSFNLLTGAGSEHVSGELVSGGYFRVLGIEPVAGRLFTAEEASPPGGHRVVLLGHDLWRSAFGGDPEVVERELILNGESYRIVGVLPPGFRGLTDGAQIWIPAALASELLAPELLTLRRYRWLSAVGRLRPGVSTAQAQAGLDAVTRRLAAEFPDTNEGVGARVTPLADAWFGDLRLGLFFLLGGAALVLLVSSINIAGLQLGRALSRRREISIRSALGAGPGRLVRELLAESLLLALLGCAAGLVLAAWALRLLVRTGAVQFKSFLAIGLDPLALGITVLVSVLCGLGFGLAPAWMAARADLSGVLREGGKGTTSGRGRARSALIVAEIGLALALLIVAGLMVQGFRTLRGSDLGFTARDLLTLRIYLEEEKYAGEAAVRGLARELAGRLRTVPGVGTVALEGPGLPTDDWFGADFALEDPPPDLQEENKTLLLLHHVTPGYFATLGIPLREGRDFGPEDGESGAPVVIVSEALARRAWPGGALGRGLRPFRDPEAPWARVVGVVADVRHRGLAPATVPAPDIYFPLLQRPAFSPPVLNFLVRPAPGVEPASLAPALRNEIREAAPALPVYDVATLEERLDRQAARPRFLVVLMGLFAGIALLLAAIGLYGVMSNAVGEATRAIGVRMALGAARGDVLRWVLGRAAVLALAGIALGVGASLALTRILTSVLYGVSATDPLTFAGTALTLLGVALFASALPALRAIRVDPAVVLRTE
jgi:putative ABC transport system permease protein